MPNISGSSTQGATRVSSRAALVGIVVSDKTDGDMAYVQDATPGLEYNALYVYSTKVLSGSAAAALASHPNFGSVTKSGTGRWLEMNFFLAYAAEVNGSLASSQIVGAGATNFLEFDVTGYGADPTGVADSTTAFRLAVAAASTSGYGGVVRFTGRFLITGKIDIETEGVYIRGTSKYSSQIVFNPPIDATEYKLFNFSAGAAVLYATGISDTRITGATLAKKCAIDFSDVSSFRIQNVEIVLGGVNSVGIRSRGREVVSIDTVSVSCERPIVFALNPQHGVAGVNDADHYHFSNVYLNSTSVTNPLIEVANGAAMQCVNFDGYQAWVGGKYGFRWIDTTSTSSSIGLTIENVRYERPVPGAGGLIFEIGKTGTANSLQNLSIVNCQGGAGGADNIAGIFLRGCPSALIERFDYNGIGSTWLDIDSTSARTRTTGCLIANGILVLNQNGATGAIVAQSFALGSSLGQDALFDGEANSQHTILLYGLNCLAGRATLVDGASTFIQMNGNQAPAEISFFATNAAGSVIHHAMIVDSFGSASTAVKILGTVDIAMADTPLKLCYIHAGYLSPAPYSATIKNNTGVTLTVGWRAHWATR